MRKRNTTAAIAILGAALGLLPAAALAAPRSYGSCRDEIKKLCPDTNPGSPGYRQCVKEHASDLSPACQDRVAHKAGIDLLRRDCGDEIKKLCGGAANDQFAIRGCLHEHEGDLSKECKAQLEAQQEHGSHVAHKPTAVATGTPGH